MSTRVSTVLTLQGSLSRTSMAFVSILISRATLLDIVHIFLGDPGLLLKFEDGFVEVVF
jgi:hypothetical protein